MTEVNTHQVHIVDHGVKEIAQHLDVAIHRPTVIRWFEQRFHIEMSIQLIEIPHQQLADVHLGEQVAHIAQNAEQRATINRF